MTFMNCRCTHTHTHNTLMHIQRDINREPETLVLKFQHGSSLNTKVQILLF